MDPMPKYLIAVTKEGRKGVVFDRTQGKYADSANFVVAWSDGRIELVGCWNNSLVFVRFLSSEVEANDWLEHTG